MGLIRFPGTLRLTYLFIAFAVMWLLMGGIYVEFNDVFVRTPRSHTSPAGITLSCGVGCTPNRTDIPGVLHIERDRAPFRFGLSCVAEPKLLPVEVTVTHAHVCLDGGEQCELVASSRPVIFVSTDTKARDAEKEHDGATVITMTENAVSCHGHAFIGYEFAERLERAKEADIHVEGTVRFADGRLVPLLYEGREVRKTERRVLPYLLEMYWRAMS